VELRDVAREPRKVEIGEQAHLGRLGRRGFVRVLARRQSGEAHDVADDVIRDELPASVGRAERSLDGAGLNGEERADKFLAESAKRSLSGSF
jgi:hypothetical protein